MRDKNQQSPVDSFYHNGESYRHVIYCSDDDRIELLNREGEVLLIFDHSCGIYTPDKKSYGRIKMLRSSPDLWESDIFGKPTLQHRDLLKLEVEISKQYLDSLVSA